MGLQPINQEGELNMTETTYQTELFDGFGQFYFDGMHVMGGEYEQLLGA